MLSKNCIPAGSFFARAVGNSLKMESLLAEMLDMSGEQSSGCLKSIVPQCVDDSIVFFKSLGMIPWGRGKTEQECIHPVNVRVIGIQEIFVIGTKYNTPMKFSIQCK